MAEVLRVGSCICKNLHDYLFVKCARDLDIPLYDLDLKYTGNLD
jgi:hypothetical protein